MLQALNSVANCPPPTNNGGSKSVASTAFTSFDKTERNPDIAVSMFLVAKLIKGRRIMMFSRLGLFYYMNPQAQQHDIPELKMLARLGVVIAVAIGLAVAIIHFSA
ncbi:hypothetical protein RLW55_08845 [Hyphomicrobium sp. B1]|uniref:hypothetical protein n=1 Tax=Hyphomicrobium sp. B1 TaxID=3075651 RepID=UPI003C300488